MVGRLILIAHGETDAIRQARFGADEGLRAGGQAAAQARAACLMPADKAFVSPARAAIETAAALAITANVDADLRDLDVGGWAGRTIRALAANDPAALAAWRGDPGFTGHGGESIDALLARVGAWLAARQAHRGTTLAITHPMVCRAAVASVLGARHSAFWAVDIAPLGRVVFSSDGHRWSLRELIADRE